MKWAAMIALMGLLASVGLATQTIEETNPEGADDGPAAERAIVYDLLPDAGPRFRVGGDAEVLQLLVHLELPSTTTRALYEFGVTATLRGPDGAAVWTRVLTQRARQTEAAFVADRLVSLTDAASVVLTLPAAPPGSTLEVRLATAGTLGEDGWTVTPFAAPRALVRAYRQRLLDLDEREQRRTALLDADERRLTETYLPWFSLTATQQQQHLASAWIRLAAEGRAGVDYQVRSIYVAAPRPSPRPPPDEPALTIGAGQPAVFQLVGPGAIEVRAWPMGLMPAGRPQTVRMHLHRIVAAAPTSGEAAPDPVPVEQTLTVVPGAVESAALVVPPGWWSLELATDLPDVAVQVRADAPERHAGPDGHAMHVDGDGRAFVPVDVQRLQLYTLGAGTPPLPVALVAGADAEDGFLQVDVRAVGAPAAVALTYSFHDAAGALLDSGRYVAATTRAAPFDRLGTAPAHDEGGALAQALGFPLGTTPVSEPVALRLLAPPGAAQLRVSTTAPALVAIHGRLAGGGAPSASPWIAPYPALADVGMRWRHAPRSAARTFPRRAEDHAARAAAGQVVLLMAQVRAEPVAARMPLLGPWRTEEPRGAHPRVRLLERVAAAQRGEALAHWGPGSFTRLQRGAPERLDLARGGLIPARVGYQATGSAEAIVGKSLAVAIDGHTHEILLRSRAGRLDLPGRRGAATMRWDAGPDGVAVLVNRPPLTASGAPVYEQRWLHRLGAGGLTIGFDKPDAAPIGVNIVVYWLGGAAAGSDLLIEVDGGAPRRLRAAPVSAVFKARRTAQASPTRRVEVLFPDERGAREVGTTRLAVVLGDDVVPGRHHVRVRPVGGAPVWLRFFHSGEERKTEGAWQWNTRTAGTMGEADADE